MTEDRKGKRNEDLKRTQTKKNTREQGCRRRDKHLKDKGRISGRKTRININSKRAKKREHTPKKG